MSTPNPATPTAPAVAAPGSPASVITPPSAATAAAAPSEGKVTISTKEFAQLSRDAARGRSAQKRTEIRAQGTKVPDGAPTDVAAAISEANERAAAAEKSALQAQVRGAVRDLLEKDEFKALAKSTKELILKNPASLSAAETLEESLLDIEEYVRDIMVIDMPAAPQNANAQPPGHQAPAVTTAGAPAPAAAAGLEDLSKLRGPARSQAAIRNAMKTAKGVVKV